MKKLTKRVLISGIVGSVLLSGTALAKTTFEKIAVQYANIKLNVDGKVIPTSAEPFGYNKNVYAPVATIANALGIHQEWDNKTRSVLFEDNETYKKKKFSGTGQELEQGVHYDGKGINGTNFYIGRDKLGNYTFFDLSDPDPYKMFSAPIVGGHVGKDWQDYTRPMNDEMMTNITGADMDNNEFILEEGSVVNHESWLNLFRYDKQQRKLDKLDAINLFDGVESGLALSTTFSKGAMNVTYSKDGKVVLLRTYETKTGKFIKTGEYQVQ